MKKLKYGILIFLLIVIVGLVFVSRQQAYMLTHNAKADRFPMNGTPADEGMKYEDVTVINDIQQTLHGWYIPPKNGVVIMLLHGKMSNRSMLIKAAGILTRHDYGVLFTSMRSHDVNEGDLITFGLKEMSDIDVWFKLLADKKEVSHIGIFGNSLGGLIAIKYAATNKDIEAVVAHSPLSSLEETVDRGIKIETGLPPSIFSPLIIFWAERMVDGDIKDINAKKVIDQISPRPVFIMQGGADNYVSPECGESLFQAAKEPKEFWYEPDLGHVSFYFERPEEFEKRVVGFYDRYLLKKE